MAYPENNIHEIGIVGLLEIIKNTPLPNSLKNWQKNISFTIVDKNLCFMWIIRNGEWDIVEGEMLKPDFSINVNEIALIKELTDNEQDAYLFTEAIPPLGIGDGLKFCALMRNIKDHLRGISSESVEEVKQRKIEKISSTIKTERTHASTNEIPVANNNIIESKLRTLVCPNCKSQSVISHKYCIDPSDGKEIAPVSKTGGIFVLALGFLLLVFGLVMLISLISILFSGDTLGVSPFFAVAVTIFLLGTGSKVVGEGFKMFREAQRQNGLSIHIKNSCNNCKTSWND